MAIGFLNVYKDRGMTSHDVINRLRKISGIKQIGHGGTLDPMAEGVMAVAIGKATRLLQFLNDDKTYLAEIKLGQITDTDDVEGKTLSSTDDVSHITQEEVERVLATFVGKQQQIPPIYSAIKKGGVKMYELARKGEAPDEIEARSVEMYSIELVAFELPFVRVRVACSKGTYIRSLARDVGKILGVGGCLSALLREQSGPFRVGQSTKLEALKDGGKENFSGFLLPLQEALALETLECGRDLAKRLANGQVLESDSVSSSMSPDKAQKELYIVALEGTPVALVRLKEGKLLQPEVVLVHASEI
jgi:tRNA pseudouridine55 synthase